MVMWLLVLTQVILLDLILSGDNAVVIAASAKTLPKSLRDSALVYGVILAWVVRIAMVAAAGLLIHIKLFSVVGGVFLFYVAYKMIKNHNDDGEVKGFTKTGDILSAILAIVIADISMSYDNAIALAGLTKGHPMAMVIGLAFSIAVLGICAKVGCTLLERHKWLNYIGAGVVAVIGLTMLI